jgi:hypothetical protein
VALLLFGPGFQGAKETGGNVPLNQIGDSMSRVACVVCPDLECPPSGLCTIRPFSTITGEGAYEYMGESVTSAGDVNCDGYDDVVVGAPGYNDPGSDLENEGRVMVFYGGKLDSNNRIGIDFENPDWTAYGEADNSKFGCSCASAGDVNGDGIDDIIIGSYRWRSDPENQTRLGKAYVYYGSSYGLSATPDWEMEGEQMGAHFGCAVTSGDLNGDGYSDVIIGADEYDASEEKQLVGKVYVYYGSGSGPGTTPGWTFMGDVAKSHVGSSLATANVNEDYSSKCIYDDLIIGAPNYDERAQLYYYGKVYVFHGSQNGLPLQSSWECQGKWKTHFGISVGKAGRRKNPVDGGVYDSIIVGAYTSREGGLLQRGNASIYYGSANGLDSNNKTTVLGENAGDFFGHCVGFAGKINDDDYEDFFVSATGYDTKRGKVYFFYGTETGINTSYSCTLKGGKAHSEFGYAVALAGNVDGDCCDDIIIGQHLLNTAFTDAGAAYVYYGDKQSGCPYPNKN